MQVTKKLAGHSARTASWSTNVGNESGEVLMSVLTTSEGTGLKPMTQGLVRRYAAAGEAPPELLYVDRDCCVKAGEVSKLQQMFAPWDILVRLDVWHFMRRFTLGCTTDAHPLYGTFMSKLSACIFQWDDGDMKLLRAAKKAELQGKSSHAPTATQVDGAVSKKEMALHCRRQTRGVANTSMLIQELLNSMTGLTDFLAVPLFNKEKMDAIWEVQRKHVRCIQDPPGVVLYTKVRSLGKGGVKLPVYRCGRGSTSLESFHLHLNRFIPGSSASAMHFQMYLLEGLARWNVDRGLAALRLEEAPLRCFDVRLKESVEDLSRSVLGKSQFAEYRTPGLYTGELIGVEYLLSQTGESLSQLAADALGEIPEEANDEDEGYEEADDATVPLLEHTDEPSPSQTATSPLTSSPSAPASSPEPSRRTAALLSSGSDMETGGLDTSGMDTSGMDTAGDTTGDESESVDSKGIPGWDRVDRLASYLVHLESDDTLSLTDIQVADLIALYGRLNPYDRERTVYSPRHKKKQIHGRFKSTKGQSRVIAGTESTQRSFLGTGTPAQWPSCNRIVEAVCLKLCAMYASPRHGVSGTPDDSRRPRPSQDGIQRTGQHCR